MRLNNRPDLLYAGQVRGRSRQALLMLLDCCLTMLIRAHLMLRNSLGMQDKRGPLFSNMVGYALQRIDCSRHDIGDDEVGNDARVNLVTRNRDDSLAVTGFGSRFWSETAPCSSTVYFTIQ